MSGYGGGPVMGVPASATAARALMSSAATGTGRPAGRGGLRAGRPEGRCRPVLLPGGGQPGQGMPPGGDAPAGQHAEPERERLGARVQGCMAKLLVAGVQHAAGGTVLASMRAGAWFSSRVAR